MNANEVSFADVAGIWKTASGGATLGILYAFESLVTCWKRESIAASTVGELRFIGGDRTSSWVKASKGSLVVKDSYGSKPERPTFVWDPAWALIAIRDPQYDTGECHLRGCTSKQRDVGRSDRDG